MYCSTLTECLRRIKDLKDKGKPNQIGIMVASHNEDTVRYAIEKIVWLWYLQKNLNII